MNGRFFFICGIVLAVAGACALYALDPARQPQAMATALQKVTNADPEQIVALSAVAVRDDSANAYAWAAYGEALASANRVQQARSAFRRATDLAQNVPQIWFHDAVFHFKLGETASGLRSVSRIAGQVNDYDKTFFHYFDRIQLEPAIVLREFADNRRLSRAYTRHLIAVGNIDGAQQVWHTVVQRGLADDRLSAAYVNSLLHNRRYDAAQQGWAASRKPSDYPQRNLVFNGDFETDFTGCTLDWGIKESKDFDTARDDSIAHTGRWSLKITFHGDSNVSYENLMQTVRVHPGKHRFQVWIRTANLTTDEGVRVQIFDPENPARLTVQTNSVTGTQDWMPLDASFTVPEPTNVIAIRIIRVPSLKFDNAIAGTAWLDSVSLQRVS